MTKKKTIKAFAIVSDLGMQYDANGNSMALAIYLKESDISEDRKFVMIEGDRIIPVTITFSLNNSSE